jgi:hypothetical protein
VRIKYFSLLLLLNVFGCQASANPAKTELLYSGHVFSVPQNPTLVASIGGDDNILVLRYGPEKSKKYIAFSDVKSDESQSFGCEASVFFAAIFTASSGDSCNSDELTAFKDVFVNGHDVGEWSGDKLKVYFSIGKDQSFLFAFDATGKMIKIDTDYLSKTELKDVVSNAL